MTTPLLNILEEGQSSASSVVSSTTPDNVCQKKLELKEHNYMGLSDCSSDESSTIVDNSERIKCGFNLKVTELRLGLPGSQSPERNTELCLQSPGNLDEKPLFPFLSSKEDILSPMSRNVVLGNKRGFSDAMEDFSQAKNTIFVEGNWMFPEDGPESETAHSVAQGKFPLKSGINFMLSRASQNAGAKSVSVQDQSGVDSTVLKDILPSKGSQEKSCGANGTTHNQMDPAANIGNPPAAKAQVIGWPPIRSYRKNTLSTTSKNKEDKNNEEVDGKPGLGALYVKVSMDGAPYLRKVDLRAYSSYNDLSSALGKMFSCFTIGPCGSHGPGREVLSESKLRDLLHGSEYVLAYEDKDLDWMLVGDVPWEMFIDSCKRLRIMKSSDAIGLAPRATEKCKEGLAK